MPSTATIYPTAATSTGNTWSGETGATGNSPYTLAQFTASAATTGTLQLSGYGAQAAVGGTATVDSVDIGVAGWRNAQGGNVTALTAQLLSGTTPIGTPTAMTVSSTFGYTQIINFAGPKAPSYAQLADLRVNIAVTAGSGSTTYYIDYVALAVNYTPGGGGTTTGTSAGWFDFFGGF